MSTPAPAVLNLPTPRAKRLPGKPAQRGLEAPAGYEVDIQLLLARVTIRGVCGVPTSAVAQYVEMLERGLAEQARQARLAAITLVPPASIGEALAEVCDDDEAYSEWLKDEEHDPSTCTDPCCSPDDLDDDALFVADEGHVVLSDASGYYGVSSMGGW